MMRRIEYLKKKACKPSEKQIKMSEENQGNLTQTIPIYIDTNKNKYTTL